VGTKARIGDEVVLAVDLFAGGSSSREAIRIFQGLPLGAVERATERILRFYRENRLEGESFSEFVRRVGPEPLKTLVVEEVGLGTVR